MKKISNLHFQEVVYVEPFSKLKKEVTETLSSVKGMVNRSYSVENRVKGGGS